MLNLQLWRLNDVGGPKMPSFNKYLNVLFFLGFRPLIFVCPMDYVKIGSKYHFWEKHMRSMRLDYSLEYC
jgi:hypothetical protein